MAQFIGTLVAACPAVPYGPLYTKVLERGKIFASEINKGNFEEKMKNVCIVGERSSTVHANQYSLVD